MGDPRLLLAEAHAPEITSSGGWNPQQWGGGAGVGRRRLLPWHLCLHLREGTGSDAICQVSSTVLWDRSTSFTWKCTDLRVAQRGLRHG